MAEALAGDAQASNGADGGQRDYFPTLGRWTSLDPLGYDAGDINLYWALGNSPAHGTDPSGLI